MMKRRLQTPAQRKRNKTRTRRLVTESLESRCMLCSVTLYDNGNLIIDGTSGNDAAIVNPLSGSQGVDVTLYCGEETKELSAEKSPGLIVFYGHAGDDWFINNTAIRSWAFGGKGVDRLYGGSSSDFLQGGSGGDYLAGRAGNDALFGGAEADHMWGGTGRDQLHGEGGGDMLYGGTEDDSLYGGDGGDELFGDDGDDVLFGGDDADDLRGGNGDDVLHGEDGNDMLRGGDDDDSLYGGDGFDQLYGQNGNDGLYGGAHTDQLTGGAGADRFLLDTFSYYNITDQQVFDARIRFAAGQSTFKDGVVYPSKQWTSSEIEAVDKALAVLHKKTGDTRLLKKATGSQIRFERLGTPTSSTDTLGWNSGGTMTIVDAGFTSSIPLVQTVFHEIGHNWDNETIFWSGFMQLSGWTALPTSAGEPAGFTRAQDSNGVDQPWVYLDEAQFARDYGRTSPNEDFATCFAALFMQEAGWNYVGNSGDITDKIDYIDKFIV